MKRTAVNTDLSVPVYLEQLGRRLGLCTIVVIALSISRVAAADDESGRGVGLGPVLSFNFDGTVSVGWEVSGNYLFPFVKGSIGGDYRLIQKVGEPSFRHYVAFEPWLYVGGTVGATITNEFQPEVMYGAWEGFPVGTLDGTDFLNGDGGIDDDKGVLTWAITIAIGWRGFGLDNHQIYFTPKIWRIVSFDLFS